MTTDVRLSADTLNVISAADTVEARLEECTETVDRFEPYKKSAHEVSIMDLLDSATSEQLLAMAKQVV